MQNYALLKTLCLGSYLRLLGQNSLNKSWNITFKTTRTPNVDPAPPSWILLSKRFVKRSNYFGNLTQGVGALRPWWPSTGFISALVIPCHDVACDRRVWVNWWASFRAYFDVFIEAHFTLPSGILKNTLRRFCLQRFPVRALDLDLDLVPARTRK